MAATREATTAAWYRKRSRADVHPPTVTLTRAAHAAIGRQPAFTTPDGYTVRAISLDGVAQYVIEHGGFLVAYAKDLTEVGQYVDLADLTEETPAA